MCGGKKMKISDKCCGIHLFVNLYENHPQTINSKGTTNNNDDK
jgi:hypothetical protein